MKRSIVYVITVLLVTAFALLSLISWKEYQKPTMQSISHVSNNEPMKGASVSPVVSLLPTLIPLFTPTPSILPPLFPGEQGVHVPVLLYHYISENPYKEDKVRSGLSTPPRVLDDQLKTLKSQGYSAITLDELGAFFDKKQLLPSKPLILTFDDGYVDFYTYAFPILTKYAMKGIAFLPTGLIGGGAYMTWKQVEEVGRSPFVAIGAHSVHHYALNKLNEESLTFEVTESKRVLEGHLGYPINWMAYPYGTFDERVARAVQAAGYIGSATTLPGAMQYRSRFLYLPRYRAGARSGVELVKFLEAK